MSVDSFSEKINFHPKTEAKTRSHPWLDLDPKGENYKKIIENSVILGSKIKSYDLDIDYLDYSGLGPKHYTKINGRHVCLSDPYLLENGRLAAIGYIFNTKTHLWETKSYYQSQSQGIWRFLPSYDINNEGQITHYSKGKFGEDSQNIPFVMQEELAKISQKPPLEIDYAEKTMVAISLDTNKDKKNDQRHTHFDFKKVFSQPNSQEYFPNFSNQINNFDFKNKLYGRIQGEIYPSLNHRLNYLICRSQSDQVWLAGVEYVHNNSINNDGLWETWVNPRGLTTPAMEYKSQAGVYANKKIFKGPYVGMDLQNPIITAYKKR